MTIEKVTFRAYKLNGENHHMYLSKSTSDCWLKIICPCKSTLVLWEGIEYKCTCGRILYFNLKPEVEVRGLHKVRQK